MFVKDPSATNKTSLSFMIGMGIFVDYSLVMHTKKTSTHIWLIIVPIEKYHLTLLS